MVYALQRKIIESNKTKLLYSSFIFLLLSIVNAYWLAPAYGDIQWYQTKLVVLLLYVELFFLAAFYFSVALFLLAFFVLKNLRTESAFRTEYPTFISGILGGVVVAFLTGLEKISLDFSSTSKLFESVLWALPQYLMQISLFLMFVVLSVIVLITVKITLIAPSSKNK